MKKISYSEAVRLAMTECMEQDDNVFLMGEDIALYGGAFGVTKGMLKKFGSERIINTPLSEGAFVGMAIGAALQGARPVVEIMFMDFITLAVDQLVNQAAKLRYVYGKQAKCPLVVRAVGGAGRNYGPTHSQNLEAWFCHTPGLKVVAPATVQEAYEMMKGAVFDDNPVIFLEHKLLYPVKDNAPVFSEKGNLRSSQIIREGSDVTIISYSYMIREAEAAADILEKQDISAEIVNLTLLNPMNDDIFLESVRKTGRVVIVAEETSSCGVASEIACRIAEKVYDYLDAPVKRLTMPDIPVPATPLLEKAAVPDRADIVSACMEIMEY